MNIGLHYKNERHIIEECWAQDLLFLKFPILERAGIVKHGFSTRLGGVSKGDCASMNISMHRGDDPRAVEKNRRRIAAAIGVSPENMVYAQQTHTTNVAVAAQADAGRSFPDTDGMITDVPGLCLVTFYADCVPLYFVDPIRRAIGLSHSGWRGTVNKMANVTVSRMREAFGSRPEEIIAVVGPSICQDCYEVGEDVILAFKENYRRDCWEELFYQKENGKYQLDLWKANEYNFLEAGIRKDLIAVTNLCTCCNPDLLFSHRVSGWKRGNLSAFLALKE